MAVMSKDLVSPASDDGMGVALGAHFAGFRSQLKEYSSDSSIFSKYSGGSDTSEEAHVPKEFEPVSLEQAEARLDIYIYLPGNEFIFLIPEGGPIQFIRGDRPQEFFGTEVCLVRNHRFEGFYFLRTNGIVGLAILEMIAANIRRNCSIEDRNRAYLESKAFIGERIIGVDCGMYVDETSEPYLITFSPVGLEMYQKAMLVFSSPWAMDVSRRDRRPSRLSQVTSFESVAEDSESESSVQIQALIPFEAPALLNMMDKVTLSDSSSGNSIAPSGTENSVAGENIVPLDTTIRRNAQGQLIPRHHNKKTNVLYKTEMCRNWGEVGECRYGRSCQFAHGNKELRVVKRHGQWKTKTCLAWVNGGCTYGSRCCYAHEHLDQNYQQEVTDGSEPQLSINIAPRPARTMAAPARNDPRNGTLPPAGVSRFAGFFDQQLSRV